MYQKFENTGVCFWPVPLVTQFGSFLVVYCRIEEISRVNVSCAGPHNGTHASPQMLTQNQFYYEELSKDSKLSEGSFLFILVNIS